LFFERKLFRDLLLICPSSKIKKADMKKKSDIGTWFYIIFFIGLVTALTTGDIEIGNYFNDWGSIDIKVLLDYLSAGLAFLTFGLLLLFFMIGFTGRKQ
jgi:hypothetical protein